jgi:hypothetical protein
MQSVESDHLIAASPTTTTHKRGGTKTHYQYMYWPFRNPHLCNSDRLRSHNRFSIGHTCTSILSVPLRAAQSLRENKSETKKKRRLDKIPPRLFVEHGLLHDIYCPMASYTKTVLGLYVTTNFIHQSWIHYRDKDHSAR